jgi:hypothetical protein
MKRSAGITITAVIDFVGCGFTFLSAGFSLLVVALESMAVIPMRAGQSAAVAFPPILKYIQIFSCILLLAFVAWGVATAVGLLKLREWARISQLLFAALMTLIALSTVLLFIFIQLPMPPDDRNPELSRTILAFTRIFITIFYGALAALGAWWLYYFSKKSVREEFRSGASARISAPANGEPFRGPMSNARPVSISIIAALFLISVLGIPFIPLARVPFMFFGYVFYGWEALAVALPFAALQGAAAYGLLKLKMWGRTLAIIALLVGLANLICMALLPGSQARFDDAMQSIYTQWRLPTTIPIPHLPVALMMLPAIPLILAELWYVIKEKPAFLAASRTKIATTP